MQGRLLVLALALVGCSPPGRSHVAPPSSAASAALAPSTSPALAPGTGTLADPFVIRSFPFVERNDTRRSASRSIDHYSCAPQLGEEGPELVYRLRLAHAGTLQAEVAEDPGVDVDLHLLDDLGLSGMTATGCRARANTLLQVPNLAAGTYYLVVDSYSKGGSTFAGGFRLSVEVDYPDRWQRVDVVPGVQWRKKVHTGLYGQPQTTNVLVVDLGVRGLEAKPRWTGSGIKTSAAETQPAAVAAVNGGFFGPGQRSLCLVKVDGALLVPGAMSGQARRAFGIAPGGQVLFEPVDAGANWPAARQALGGHPNLVTAGRVDIWPSAATSFATSRHPRTAVGVDAAGKLLWVTVDGRTSAGAGMSLNELARFLIDLGAVEAINLDGGGSTTMWVREMSINGVVNHPSDNGRADHHGERTVSDALVVYRR
ncbi:MAG: phosphodiester glycosidase family protein [Planctomycetes bacterium]|nr:phosphodiester glycosidase family protein [Planctomycetota bacterium]